LAGLLTSIHRIARPATWLAAAALALGAMQFAQAQAVWTGPPGVAADWFDPGNWLDGVVPTSGSATINNGGIAQRSLNIATTLASGLFLGSEQLGSGTLIVSGGTLSLTSLEIGRVGIGQVEQSGGTISTSYPLYIGTGSAGSAGHFILTGGSFSNGWSLDLGSDHATTTGTFAQSGGVSSHGTLSINSGGRYTLSAGLLSIKYNLTNRGEFDFANGSATLSVSANGFVDFSQRSPTGTANANVVGGAGALIILPAGSSPAMFSTYANAGKTHIAGTPLTIPPAESFSSWRGNLYEDVNLQGTLNGSELHLQKGLTISGSGVGTFSSVQIANQTSGMSGGTLFSGTFSIMDSAGATFSQTGGTASLTFSSGRTTLTVGANAGTSGTYSLSSGTLVATNAVIGGSGTGTFLQTGGTSSFGTLSVASGSTLGYSGGELNIGELKVRGTLDLASSAVTIAPTGIADFASTTFQGASNATLVGAADSLLIFSPGVDPNAVFGSFSTGGIVHTAGSTLVVLAGHAINAIGEIEDPVELHGTIAGAVPIGGMAVYDGGVLNAGTLDLQIADINVHGGSITLSRLNVLNGRSITQSGGTVTISTGMELGTANSASTGTYRLEDGVLRIPYDGPKLYLRVLGIDNGTFLQSGGTNSIFHNVGGFATGIGIDAGGFGYYELSGGTLNATSTNFSVGYSGNGTMVQSAGNAIIGSLRVGEYRTGTGYYSLSDGTLDGGRVTVVGYLGEGTLIQSGGTFTTSWLEINFDVNHGWLAKSAGYLGVGSLVTGPAGVFIHSGGTLTLPAMKNVGSATLGGIQVWAPNSILANTGIATFTSNAGAVGRNLTINDTEGTIVFSASQTLNALNIGQARASIVPGSDAVIGVLGLGMSFASPVHAFDLADGTLVINYLSTTPAASVRSMLAADQLYSSLGDAQHRLGYAEVSQVYSTLPVMIGDEPIDSTGLLVELTLAGDANLDGVVDAADLGNFATHWNTANAFWFDGDFTYDGLVDVADLKLLAINFTSPADGASLETLLVSFGLPVDVVPEPTIALFAVSGFSLLRRKR
jgi:hypothetical protein